ncbi:MAG: DEAD/DEAH box helicase [Candidatus Micrarchaeota archaeon]
MDLSALPLKPGAVEPRPYQIEMARSLLEKGNSLVVMPTALGKTFVALIASAMLLSKNSAARLLVLAPTKPLVLQQAKRFEDSLVVSGVEVLTGEVPPVERVGKWGAQVVACTPQTALADLLTRRWKPSDFALVVFDEAHRAVGDYAYAFLGRQFAASGALVLGLTASPSSEREKIDEITSNLGICNVQIRSENDADVAPFVNRLSVRWEFVDLPPEFRMVKASLEELLREPLLELKHQGFVESADLTKVTSRSLLEARQRILAATRTDKAAFRALSLHAKCMNLTHAIGLLESQGVLSLKAFLESLKSRKEKSKAVVELAADFRVNKLIGSCSHLVAGGLEHPKLSALANIVSQAVAGGKFVIVFAHYRGTVANLVAQLNALPGVSARALVGKSGQGMSQKQQAGVIAEFRSKSFNVLVASSIGEEGLDIPTVDLVVFFEPVPSEIRSIQRRGRAGRTRAGSVMVLVAKGTRDEAFFWISRKKERDMRETIESMRDGEVVQRTLPEA